MRYRIFLAALIVVATLVAVVNFWSYLFARKVQGPVVDVARPGQSVAIMGGNGNQVPSAAIFSVAVAIQDEKSGEIFTSSSEDRQWAVVSKGQCAEAKFFPYPPWDLDKGGTYHNARLLRLYNCPGGAGAGSGNTAPSAPAAPAPEAPAAPTHSQPARQ